MSVWLNFLIIITMITCCGYVLLLRNMVLVSWILSVFSVLLIHLLFLEEAPVSRMIALITTAFTGMKVVTSAVSYHRKSQVLTFARWVAFVFTWAGMRVKVFEDKMVKSLPGAEPMAIQGITSICAGISMVLIARVCAGLSHDARMWHVLATGVLLTGFSLILHFGILNLSAGIWRFLGLDAYYLFKNPLKAKTLNEFWSKRWNIAFSEMTAVSVFRPLKARLGETFALSSSFIFSGVLHELALSVPVNGGYGLPTAYFMIQALGVGLERNWLPKYPRWRQNIAMQRIWLFGWLIIPLPLLVHERFIDQIVWAWIK